MNKMLCSECGDGLVIADFIMYLVTCENCDNIRMCQLMEKKE